MNPNQRCCSRCESDLERPHDQCCNYVRSSDFAETETRERYYALKHTPETRKRVQRVADRTDRDFDALAAEMAQPEADDTIRVSNGTTVEEDGNALVETAAFEEVPFSIPLHKFDREEVKSPSVVDRNEIAYVQTVEEKVEVVKSGLVCPECATDDDEILWGVDA